MTSFIYRHPKIYQAIMRRLDGKNFEERHACIAPLIRLGDSITALCVGDGYLFQHYFVKQAN